MTKERKAAVKKIQGKLRQFVRLFAPGVAKPRVKFLRDMHRGILIAESPIVTEIARGSGGAIPRWPMRMGYGSVSPDRTDPGRMYQGYSLGSPR